jgi:hypothetical protein
MTYQVIRKKPNTVRHVPVGLDKLKTRKLTVGIDTVVSAEDLPQPPRFDMIVYHRG